MGLLNESTNRTKHEGTQTNKYNYSLSVVIKGNCNLTLKTKEFDIEIEVEEKITSFARIDANDAVCKNYELILSSGIYRMG